MASIISGSNKGKTETPVISSGCRDLENVFVYEWHCFVAFGIFVGIYLKCTAASIPSGDAGMKTF